MRASPVGKLLLSPWLGNPVRRAALLLGTATLILLTVIAALPIKVIGLVDARTYEPAKGMRLDFAPEGAALEPVTALAHIVMEAPDAQVAAVSVPIWIVGVVMCGAVISQLHRNRWRANWRTTVHTSMATAGAVVFVLVYSMFALLVRIPNWRVIAQDPDIVLTDLHTHTFGSYDGLISAGDNLRWQAQRGCSVVAITEHNSPKGSLEAATVAENDESLPAVLPGVEIYLKEFGYLTAIAPREELAGFVLPRDRRSFISYFHQSCRGAVISMMAHLTPERLQQAIDSGIDGLEIANQGHPSPAPALRKTVLSAADDHRLPLVAWTDWHGLGGILRAWTAVRVPHASTLSRAERAAAVLDALRRHECSKITPLVIGRMGQVSLARVIFAPFVESARYAASLSPLRVLAWWAWGVGLFLLATGLFYVGIRPSLLILAGMFAAMGTAVSVKSLQLILASACGQAPFFFPAKFGLASMAVGIAALLSGAVSGWLAVCQRRILAAGKWEGG
jgi:hypothetical protein